MKTIVVILQFLLGLSIDFCALIIDAFSKPTAFNAKFANERTIGSRFHKGFVYSKNRKLSRRKSLENIIISGPTGSGKSSKIIIKSLFTLKHCSILITDPSRELYEKTSGYLSRYFTIRTINYSDATISSGYNPLSRIKKPNDINKIAHLLVITTLEKGYSGDKFWSLSVKTLLQLLIRLTLHQPEQFRNMANVLHLLHCFSAYPEKVDRLVANTKDEKLITEYKSFISTPEKTLQNIVASAKAALQLFDDPEIAKTTAYDSITFDTLRQEPTIIFLHNSIGDQKYVSVLNSIFFEQFYNHVLQRIPNKKELPIYVILEECASMYIEILPLALANCRKNLVGNMLCVQSHTQLTSNYHNEAENITANCVTKLFLAGMTSMDVLREIESLSGKYIYKDDKGIDRTKNLITVDEIRLLPENRSLIISGNKPIIKGRVSPYWHNLLFRRYAKIPSVSLQGDIPDTPTPLINLS